MSTFQIRDDFNGTASAVTGRAPNIRTGTGSTATWRADSNSFYPLPGTPSDGTNYGLLIFGDGTAQFRGGTF